jgi:hypothetical protein
MKLNDERRKALTEYLGDLTTASFERRIYERTKLRKS